jgi:alpha-glucosidase (family GH31 glycosyl hydrolase)
MKDPAINSEEANYTTYTEGQRDKIWIKWPASQNPQLNETGTDDNEFMLGYVWPNGKTVFPDFFKNKTKDWWKQEIVNHYNNVLKFDG